jgi:hypothetical protein
MNEKIIKCYDAFQIADLDDDLIGICKSMVDWMAEIRQQIDPSLLPEPEPPFNFYKLDPHHPRMELRQNYRRMLAYSVKHQKDVDDETKLVNIYVTILAGLYIYHLPVAKMVELSATGTIDRATSEKTLLDDNMSPNWIKEPSGRDFTAIML